MSWPNVSDAAAIRYALSTIMTWETLGDTGGPSLQDAADLVVARVTEAREARKAAVPKGLTWGMSIQRTADGTAYEDRARAQRKPGRAVIHLQSITHKGSVTLAVSVGMNGAEQLFELRPGDEFYIERTS